MENKRDIAVLIPYKIKEKEIFVFLQKREKDRKVLPGHFAFFGGKIEESESPEQGLKREIQEELCFTPQGYDFFNQYLFDDWTGNVYILEVDDSFESKIKVMEGEYGKFFSQQEVLNESMIIDHDKNILEDLYKKLKN